MSEQELWQRLRDEMEYLINQGVKSMDPRIVQGYMGFLEEIKRLKDGQERTGN